MQPYNKYGDNYPTLKEPIIHSTRELLLMQSKGQHLTPEEKKRVKKYAENKRKENQRKK